jgi:hypothetical protein
MEVRPMATASPPVASRQRSAGRAYLWLGIVLVLLSPVLYVIQLQARILKTPWYAFALLTAGVVLLFVAVLRRPNVWRIALFVLFGLFAGFQGHFLLFHAKTPTYTGSVAAEASFPAFSATRADGTAFNQDSLRGARNTALVFFRGRW